MESWIVQEFKSLELGDKRLNQRANVILSQFSQEPTASIPSACKGWQETHACDNFLTRLNN